MKNFAKNFIQKPRKQIGSNGIRTRQRKRQMIFATWNVQGLSTKQKEVFTEIKKRNIDLCVLTETKKKGNGTEDTDNYIHLYTGVNKDQRAKRGVSIVIHKKFKHNIVSWDAIDERIIKLEIKKNGQEIVILGVYAPNDNSTKVIKDEFYERMQAILTGIQTTKEICILGDLNGRTGKTTKNLIVGQYGEETKNDSGQRLIDLCENHNLRIANGFYPHKEVHKFTYVQATRGVRSIIDYFIQRQISNLKTNDVRVYRGPECGSDHHLLIAKTIIHYKQQNWITKKPEEQELTPKNFNIESLTHESVQFLYKIRLAAALQQTRIEQMNAEELYNHLKKYIHQAAGEALGYKETNNRQYVEWWNNDIADKIKKKKKAYQQWITTNDNEDHKVYRRHDREVKREVARLKNEMWENKCFEIEACMGGTRVSEAWKTIKNLRKNTKGASNIPIISLQEWKSYYSNLLTETRDEYKFKVREITTDDENEMPINLKELKSALRKMKNRKASGPGDIPIELVKYAPDVLLEMLVCLFNRCLIFGDNVPAEWNWAYISSIYKKGDKRQCKNYRGISVTSSMGRLYGKIMKERIESQLTEIEEQSGFRAGRSCTDNVFTLNQIIETRTARNLNTHLIFVDLEKAYDTVPLNKLFDVLDASDLSRLYVRAIYNIYKDAKAAVKIGKNISGSFNITKGLKQGCCLSPTLFKIFIQKALDSWIKKCKYMGIEIENDCLYTLLFADDQVIIASDEDDIQYMYRKLEDELKNWGLNINVDKTEYLNVGGDANDLQLPQGTVKGCQEFKYLGSIISGKGNTDRDIQNRLTQGRRCIQMLNSLLWSPKITLKTKTMIYKVIVEPILTYGSECWQMNARYGDKLKAVEMDYLRRSCGVSRVDHVRNEEIRQRTKMTETVIDRIETRQLIWYGHVMRMGEERWPKKAVKYVPWNKRKKGRPRTTWRQNIEKTMSSRDLEENDWWDRERWRMKCGKRPRL